MRLEDSSRARKVLVVRSSNAGARHASVHLLQNALSISTESGSDRPNSLHAFCKLFVFEVECLAGRYRSRF